jgi:hypothetical protein
MKEFFQRFVTLVVALFSGTIAAFSVNFFGFMYGDVIQALFKIFGLTVDETILFPLSFIVAAPFAAIGATLVGNLFTPHNAFRRLLWIIVISEITAVIAAVVLPPLLHKYSPGSPTLPPGLVLGIVGLTFIALSVSWATWRFGGSTGGGLARSIVMQVGSLGLAVLLGVGMLYSLSPGAGAQASCEDPEAQAVLEEFPHYEEDNHTLMQASPKASKEAQKAAKSKASPPEGCAVYYRTWASEKQVYEYYTEQLTKHGWTLGETQDPIKHPAHMFITAHRDNFSYEVTYSGPPYDRDAVHFVQAATWKPSEMP